MQNIEQNATMCGGVDGTRTFATNAHARPFDGTGTHDLQPHAGLRRAIGTHAKPSLRTIAGYVSVTLIAVLFSVAVAAQDYIFTNFLVSRDLPVAPTPCTLLGPAQPVVYDTSLWLFYTCDTGQVIARRFFNDWDRNREAPRTIDRTQPAAPAACPGGFVAGMYGGCVPPDHPLAKK